MLAQNHDDWHHKFVLNASYSSRQRTFKPGETLFRERDVATSLFLIQKGCVAVRKSKLGGEVEIARVFSNEVLGELAFFDRQPRNATAIALTEVQAQEISFTGLDKIFASVPPYFKTIIASMADRLRKADNQIRTLQKDVVPDLSESEGPSSDEFTAQDALAALKLDQLSTLGNSDEESED